MVQVTYPEYFESVFVKEFIDTLENAVSPKEYLDNFREMIQAGIISDNRKLDPIFFIIVAMNRYTDYFDEANLKYALMLTFDLIEQNKTIGPAGFTELLLLTSVIDKKHKDSMLKCMESAWQSAYQIIYCVNEGFK